MIIEKKLDNSINIFLIFIFSCKIFEHLFDIFIEGNPFNYF